MEHRCSGVNVFLDSFFVKACRHVNAYLSLCLTHLLRGNDALDAAEMVGVGVADDHGSDVVANVLSQHFLSDTQAIGSRFCIGGRVNDDPAGFTADKGQVCHVNAPHLIDLPRQYFKDTGFDICLAVEPQAGVNGIRHCLLFQKVVCLQVPDYIAGLVFQPESVQLFQAAASCQCYFTVVSIFQINCKLLGKCGVMLLGKDSCFFRICVITVFRHCCFLPLNSFQNRRFPFTPNGQFVRCVHPQCQCEMFLRSGCRQPVFPCQSALRFL